jgi:Holliday junction resolvase RusA-like endonuclease
MEGQPHQSTPDCDNLLKAFFDGIMPRRNRTQGQKGCDDRKIHCYSAFKVWVKPENACIQVVEYDQDDFIACFGDFTV